jgi:aminoglycoside/choline kinase family phosphotransferase
MDAVPEDPAILPPALHEPADRIEFVEVTRLLERFHIPVPAIHGVEPQQRWVLLEDLGDLHVCDLAGPSLTNRLFEAVTLLARVHEIPTTPPFPIRRAFDEEWVRFELEHFLRYGAPPALVSDLGPEIEAIAGHVATLPRVLCLRDYQSQNLMVDPDGRLRILDYQDALLAPLELDLAAFLYDSYLDLIPERREELLWAYEYLRRIEVDPSSLALLVVQRKCKDFARFKYLAEVRGDSRFEPYRESARRAALEAAPQASAAVGVSLRGLRRALRAA